MKPRDERADLDTALQTFYNREAAYFTQAGCTNRDITPERQHLFSFVRNGDRVLDVGCGSCENAIHLGSRIRYVGCDVSLIALQMAAGKVPAGSALVQGASQRLPFADNSFDAVLSTYALEHFVYPEESLAGMWRVCRPGGLVILASPAYDDPRLLPPSVSHWNVFERAWLVAAQAWRQSVRHVLPRRFYFARVNRPRILSDRYQSDFDAVHLVSAREVANFFRLRGEIVFERKRVPRGTGATEQSLMWRIREHLRNALLRLHIGEYAGLNLQLVARKPA